MPEHADRPASGGVSRAASLLVVSRLACFGLAFVQLLLMARKFGTSFATDAFLVAEACHILFLGVIEQNLGIVLIPVFVEYRERGDDKGAWHVANALLTGAVLFLVLFTVLLAVFAPQVTGLLAPGFDAGTRALAIRLTRLLAPLALLMLTSAFLATLCFALDRFAVPAWTAVLSSAGGPLGLWLLSDRMGIAALALGVLAGHLVRLIVLFAGFPERRRLGLTLDFRHPGVRQLGRMAGPRLLSVSLVQMNFMVDRFFASFLGAGCISSLTYASKSISVPVRLVVGPMGRALMPTLSKLAARNETGELRALVAKVSAVIGFLFVPAIVVLAGFRNELLSVVFERGAFNGASVNLTAVALLFYSIGMLSYFLNPILNSTFFAVQNAASPLKVVALTAALNVALDFLLMRVLGHGGIALATSAVVTMNTLLLWRLLGRRIGRLRTVPVILSLGKTLLAALGMWALVRWLMTVLPGSAPQLGPWARGIIYAGAGGLVYVAIQAALNRKVARDAVRTVCRRGGIARKRASYM